MAVREAGEGVDNVSESLYIRNTHVCVVAIVHQACLVA